MPTKAPGLWLVAALSVLGKVIFDVPYLGYLVALVKARLGLLLTIFLPGLAIIGLALKNTWQVVLRKKTAKAEPEVTQPLNIDTPTPAPIKHHSQTEPQG